eukprot:53339_1
MFRSLCAFTLLIINIAFSDYRTVLYTGGLYQNQGENTQADTDSIIASGFSTIILWTLHIRRSDATLIYNGQQMVTNGVLNETQFGPNGMDFKSKISNLKTNSSSSVQIILFCIGSGGKNEQDYANIRAIYTNPTLKQTLYNNFQVLLDLGIDGFDFDNEEGMNGQNQNLIADMVSNFNKMGAKYLTFCPYTQSTEWINTLKIIYKAHNKQLVNWFNVQCYSGGSNNANELQRVWVNGIKVNSKSIGVHNSGYIIPGFNAKSGTARVQSEFREYGHGIVDGGFIWLWPDTTGVDDARKWYNALVNGLDGKCYRSILYLVPFVLL